ITSVIWSAPDPGRRPWAVRRGAKHGDKAGAALRHACTPCRGGWPITRLQLTPQSDHFVNIAKSGKGT
ncbi:hypothetical protein J6590_035105, partial [Homalodisca vitripennis]